MTRVVYPPFGAGSLANPTASVGLAAVNGTALTAMRSDGAPALDQTAAFAFTGLGNTVITGNFRDGPYAGSIFSGFIVSKSGVAAASHATVDIIDTGNVSSNALVVPGIAGWGSNYASGNTGRVWYVGSDGAALAMDILFQQNGPINFFTNNTLHAVLGATGTLALTPDSGVGAIDLPASGANTVSGSNAEIIFGTRASNPIYINAFNNTLYFGAVGQNFGLWSTGRLGLIAGQQLSWTSSTTVADGSADLIITRAGAARLRQGAADAASPVAQQLEVQNAATGNNNGAATWTFVSSLAVGNGTSGDHVFSTGKNGNGSGVLATITEALRIKGETQAVVVAAGKTFQVGNAAATGLAAGVLAATTNATLVITDSTGQAYRIPCII